MSVFADFRERLRALLFRNREENELDEELAFHLDQTVEQNIRAGMKPSEARRQALLTLGGVERTKEDVRDARGTHTFENFLRDTRFALRRLTKERSFSLPTLASIALGIGVTTAVFAMVNAILIKPLPYPAADRLVELRHTTRNANLAVQGLSPGIFTHYQSFNRSFDDIAVYMEHARTLTDDAETPEQVRVALVSPSLFTVLGAIPTRGRLPGGESVGEGAGTGVVISHELWVRRYGADPNIVGQTIELARQREVVVAVAQPGFHFPRPDTHVWLTNPIEEILARFSNQAAVGGLFLSGVGRLANGITTDAAERDLNRLVATLPDAYADITTGDLDEMGLRATVGPLKDSIVGDVRVALLLLATTAAFLLLMTWANATNLTLVRAERLRREVSLERALGATDGRITQRFLSEGGIIALVGGVLGLALASLAIYVRFGFDAQQIPRLGEASVDAAVLAFGLTLIFLTAFVLAVVPLMSVRGSGATKLFTNATGRFTASRRTQTGRRILVIAQVALTMILLIGSSLLAQSYQRLSTAELGFAPDNGISFFLSLPPNPYQDRGASARLHDDVLTRLRSLPGIDGAEAATSAAFPLTPVPDHYNDRITVANTRVADSTTAIRALFSFATPGYFDAMRIPVVQGEMFEESTAAGSPDVVLSAALARDIFGNTDPIGSRVRSSSTGGGEHIVIGVVGDVPSRSIREGPSNVIYFANRYPLPAADSTVVVQTIVLREEQYVVKTSLPPTTVLPMIRQAIDRADPKLVVSGVTTLDDLVSGSLSRARLTMLLLVIGAGTALFLGLIGIYGLLSYAVRQRNKELGVRVALGATSTGVVRLIVSQGVLLASGGIALGILAALGLTRYLDSLLYGVTSTDPVAFAGTAVVLLMVSLVASYLPARRAGRIDPVKVLRVE